MQLDHHLARMDKPAPPRPRPVQHPAACSEARKRQTENAAKGRADQ
jgi:hypothetical protein